MHDQYMSNLFIYLEPRILIQLCFDAPAMHVVSLKQNGEIGMSIMYENVFAPLFLQRQCILFIN
jgi:hypothetical protein